MEMNIGTKIVFYRKAKGFTQEELAERLNVSPQAVSKWENGVACPDIALLAPLAALFGTTTDDLLSAAPVQTVRLVPEGMRKSIDDLMLRVIVNSAQGDKVRVQLPMALVKIALEIGMSLPQISSNDTLKSVDLGQVLLLVERGAIGKLVEVESAEGDTVEIVVE